MENRESKFTKLVLPRVNFIFSLRNILDLLLHLHKHYKSVEDTLIFYELSNNVFVLQRFVNCSSKAFIATESGNFRKKEHSNVNKVRISYKASGTSICSKVQSSKLTISAPKYFCLIMPHIVPPSPQTPPQPV